MVANAFHNCRNAGIPHAKPLASFSADVGFPGGCAVKSDIPDDAVFFGRKTGPFGRINNQSGAAEALAEVVVGVAFQFQRHAVGIERAKTLSGRTFKFQPDGVFRQAFRAVTLSDFIRQHSADGPVCIFNRKSRPNGFAAFKRRFGHFQQRPVQHAGKPVILFFLAVQANVFAGRFFVQDGR